MTLLQAAESLQIVELAGVSWINIYARDTGHIAEFTMALLLRSLTPPYRLNFAEACFGFGRIRPGSSKAGSRFATKS
jgi:hypothetical protein